MHDFVNVSREILAGMLYIAAFTVIMLFFVMGLINTPSHTAVGTGVVALASTLITTSWRTYNWPHLVWLGLSALAIIGGSLGVYYGD